MATMENSTASYDSLDVGLAPRERKIVALNVVSFLGVIGLNGLGSTGGISGKAIGEVSDAYVTKITPASGAFSIWGLIYFGVASWLLLQMVPSAKYGLRSAEARHTLFVDIGYWFAASNLLNMIWIALFVWGTEATTWISAPFLFALVGTLVMMGERAQFWIKPRSSLLERLLLDGTFSVYGGWGTVASIVNLTTAFVSSGWKGEPWTESGWSVLMLCIAALVNVLMIFRRSNPVWALVFTWAAFWIAQAYPEDAPVRLTAMILASLVGMAAVAFSVRALLRSRKKLEAEVVV